jgi:hypothetical protein
LRAFSHLSTLSRYSSRCFSSSGIICRHPSHRLEIASMLVAIFLFPGLFHGVHKSIQFGQMFFPCDFPQLKDV